MLDPLAPDFRLLSDLLATLPKRPSPTVVWRWTTKGTRGTRLETLKIAGRQHTTRAEFRRFIQAIQDCPAPPSSEQLDALDRSLADAGYSKAT